MTRTLQTFSIVALCLLPGCWALSAQGEASTAGAQTAKTLEAPALDRGQAYFHAAIAGLYEEAATASSRPEYIGFAIEEYKKALNADPGSVQLQLNLAQLYFRAERIGEAEAAARRLLKNDADNLDAHRLLGRIYLRRLGEEQGGESASPAQSALLDDAIGEYVKILQLKPKSVEDHLLLGQLYTAKRDQAKAAEQFQIAQQIEPASEEVILNLVRAYSESENWERAAQAVLAVPESDRTLKMELSLGSIYEDQKKYKEAAEAYQRAANLEPDDPRILSALAGALLRDNQLDAALKQYLQIMELDPEDAEAQVHIGEIQRRQSKFNEALETIRKARQKDPNSLEGGFNEGLLLDVLGRLDESVEVYRQMVELTSHANGAYKKEEKNNRAIFLERLASVYLEQGKTAEAIDAYQKIVEMGGEDVVRGYQGQVDAYRSARQYGKALEVARQASAANPKDKDLKLLLASALLDVGKGEEALALAKSQLVNKPEEDRRTLMALGQMYVRLRRWREASEQFERAAALSKKKEDRPYMIFLQGELAERQKHYEQAEKFFRQALDLDPRSAMIMNYLGYMLADKGAKLDEALTLIRKAVEIDPMNGAYLDSLGWAYFKLGRYEQAEDSLRRALDRDKFDATIHEHMGDLYEKTGRTRLAVTQWEMALKAMSNSAPGEVDPGDLNKLQRKLESARIRLAKQGGEPAAPKSN